MPKRQAVPEVIIITPSPSKNEDANIEDLFANTPAYNPSFKALGPVYIPSVTEKYEIIEATPLEEVDPAMLGLPSGAVIKPASQVIAKSAHDLLKHYTKNRNSGIFKEDRNLHPATQAAPCRAAGL